MLKLFSAEKLREADQYTIKNEPIASYDLMERAADRMFDWIRENLVEKKRLTHFSIFCGIGNNGGDALAIARKLKKFGVEVEVYIVQLSKNYSEDFQKNLDRFEGEPAILNEKNHQFKLQEGTTVIDGIFGSGLNRPVEGFALSVIDQLNRFSAFTLSIDLPSGLFVEDNSENQAKGILQADITLSIQLPKLAFLFPENSKYVGSWLLIDIGLSEAFITQHETPYMLLTLNDIQDLLKSRNDFSHKGDYGHAYLMAGSKGKMGAAVLSAKACLRAGVGLLTIQVPQIGESILQMNVPEAMVSADENQNFLGSINSKINYSALGIGPGIGMEAETQYLLKLLIQQSSNPVVIDADGLNILSDNKTWIPFLPKGSILTPHPGEFKRLVGEWSSDYERLQKQIQLAEKNKLYVVLKGKYTSIATPSGKVYFNSTGNPGMATGGSGDALTGILTSLLAQQYSPLESCLLGVYLHGLAGDIAAEKIGEESMIASDLIDNIAEAFREIKN